MQKIGWIGTGVMGLAMASNLQKAGYELYIYTRTKEKAAPLLENGATWVQSPREMGQICDIVFSIVGYPKDVEEVLLGENGALQDMKKGGILVDMTTSSPDLAEHIAARCAEKGCYGLDAPVTGGDVGAKKGTLTIFVGGAQEAYEKTLPCLQSMGTAIAHYGAAGMGHKAKLANQIAGVNYTVGICEALLFAQEAGLNLEQWVENVAHGSAGSNSLRAWGNRVLHGDFTPGFYLEHLVKDLRLCIDECRRMQLTLPGILTAEATYSMLLTQGYGNKAHHSLIQGLAKFSGKEWKGVAKI